VFGSRIEMMAHNMPAHRQPTDHMLESHWQHGYPFALGLMGVVSVALYLLLSAAAGSEHLPREPCRRRQKVSSGGGLAFPT
jgi:hypothetical protein